MRKTYEEMIEEMVKDLWSAEDAQDQKTRAWYCGEMNRKVRIAAFFFEKSDGEVRRDIMEAAWG